MITKEEIEKDMSEVAKSSIKELADKTIRKFKNTGLMSPELCLIALYILDEYSDSAKSMINSFSKLDSLLLDVDKIIYNHDKKDKTENT